MAQKYTKNDAKLSKYILNKTKEGQNLPYMTVIAAESGVSVATISRYAKRKGFYSFADMRATFNKGISQPSFDDYGLVNKIMKAKNVVVVASHFTKVIGEYINARLSYLKVPVSIIRDKDFDEKISEIPEESLIICISLTGWSLRVEKTIERNPSNDIVMITTVKYKSKNKKVSVIPLTEYDFDSDDHFEGYQSIRNVYLWLDDALNILHLKIK